MDTTPTRCSSRSVTKEKVCLLPSTAGKRSTFTPGSGAAWAACRGRKPSSGPVEPQDGEHSGERLRAAIPASAPPLRVPVRSTWPPVHIMSRKMIPRTRHGRARTPPLAWRGRRRRRSPVGGGGTRRRRPLHSRVVASAVRDVGEEGVSQVTVATRSSRSMTARLFSNHGPSVMRQRSGGRRLPARRESRRVGA